MDMVVLVEEYGYYGDVCVVGCDLCGYGVIE